MSKAITLAQLELHALKSANYTDGKVNELREDVADAIEDAVNGAGPQMSTDVQYIRKSNITHGYFWFHTNGLPYKYAYENYSVVEPLVLPAGQYYVSKASWPYSWIVDKDYVVTNLGDYEPSSKNATDGFVLTLIDTVTLHLSYYTPQEVTDTTPYVVRGAEPLAAKDYFEGEKFSNVNCDVFVESYIKNCELVANDLIIIGDSIGHYNGVKMDAHITQMRCKARMTPNASIALVTTGNGSSMVTDITGGSVHLVFGFNNCAVGVFDTAGNLRVITNLSYTISENREVSFGFDVNEATNTLTVYLPDGATQTVTDSDVSVRNGQYAIWEHFCVRSVAGFKCCKITKLYCKDMNGEVLEDDLKRIDGTLGVAPTGQPYRQFTSHNLNNRDFK